MKSVKKAGSASNLLASWNYKGHCLVCENRIYPSGSGNKELLYFAYGFWLQYRAFLMFLAATRVAR